jgi:hypothetical protein
MACWYSRYRATGLVRTIENLGVAAGLCLY